MAVSENDLELLEEHLDGALDAAATTELNHRLAADTQLSAAMDEARAQRAVRTAVWQSLEPEKPAADRLLWRVRGAMLDQQRNPARQPSTVARSTSDSWRSPWRIAAVGSAVAACLMLGFLAGRVGINGPAIQPSQTAAASGETLAVNSTQTPGQFKQVGTVPQVLVPISNEYGQVVRWQPFDNAEQAKSFEEDLHKAQGGSMNPSAVVAPKLASQEQEHF